MQIIAKRAYTEYMITWMKKIQWGKVILIAFLYTIASLIVQQIETLFMIPVLPDSRSPGEFFIASTIGKFFTGISLCIIYYYLMEYLPKKTWQRMFFFADVLVATSFVFFTIPVYLLFNIPMILLGWWFMSSFILILFVSIIIIKVIPYHLKK